MHTISVCIIAKNEETRIERLLSSLAPYSFEIILVDTGSTDRTREIAVRYTDCIYDFPWIDDFSAAKNYAIEQCGGDWIALLDADEYMMPEDAGECMRLLDLWKEAEAEHWNDEMENELHINRIALRNLAELVLEGGMLYKGGRLVAFSIGEPLNTDTYVVHIEKALASVQGAYPMINQQFAEHEAAGFRYVNREEDTGAEGLRRAKLSYDPAFLMEKGLVTEK